MGLVILANTIGETATALSSSLTLRTETDVKDVIGGHRSRIIETSAKGTQLNIDYTLPSSKTLTHTVISNIDSFFDSLDPDSIEILYGATFSTSSLDTAIGDIELMGTKLQDTIIEHSQAADKLRIALKNISTSSYYRVGKIYLCESLDLGDPMQETQPQIQFLPLSDANMFPAVRGRDEYKCEAAFSLSWDGLSYSQVQSFEALPLHQPLFLYDADGDLFPYKTEHVIVDSYAISKEHMCKLQLDVSFKRLKHYEF